MAPEYVQPYVKALKTDDRKAEVIAEAATRPTMRLVTTKSEAQLDLQILHRACVAGREEDELRCDLADRNPRIFHSKDNLAFIEAKVAVALRHMRFSERGQSPRTPRKSHFKIESTPLTTYVSAT
jgi:hypothetical protein